MNREILVAVSGLHQTAQENGEKIEMVSHGIYEFTDGQHKIQYEEIDEENQEITKVTMVFSEENVEILKQGQNNAQMLFQKNKKTSTSYQTPYGELIVGIDTTGILVDESESRILLSLNYALDMNYSHVAECNVDVKITSR